MSEGVTIDELVLADEPGRWEGLGFELDGDRLQLGAVWLRLAGERAGRGIAGWSLRGLGATELDGLPTTESESPQPEPREAHPNGISAIDHVVVMTPALERSVPVLQQAGLDLRRIREEPTPAGAPRQAFFRLGAEILEVVQEPEHVVAEREGERRRPARFWGLALLAADLDRAVASARRARWRAARRRPARPADRDPEALRRSRRTRRADQPNEPRRCSPARSSVCGARARVRRGDARRLFAAEERSERDVRGRGHELGQLVDPSSSV